MNDRYDTVLLGLELNRRRDPLRGRLVSPGEPDRAFAGWLDFIAAVDAAHRASAGVTPTAPPEMAAGTVEEER
jgi:hypothetical protein